MIEIDVESAFSSFVRRFGGEVLEDTFGTSLNTLNADYVFRDCNVIAELKRLVDDKSKDEDIQAKIQAKFDAWMDQGIIGPAYGNVVIDSSTLPIQCQRELIDVFRPPLRRRVLKANRQIRETAKLLGMPDAKGLLLVANDGNYALEADMAMYLLSRILGNDCRSIHSIIYFTVNMSAASPLTHKQVLVWVASSRKRLLEPVASEFLAELFEGWLTHLERLRGESIDRIVGSDNALEQIRYERNR